MKTFRVRREDGVLGQVHSMGASVVRRGYVQFLCGISVSVGAV